MRRVGRFRRRGECWPTRLSGRTRRFCVHLLHGGLLTAHQSNAERSPLRVEACAVTVAKEERTERAYLEGNAPCASVLERREVEVVGDRCR
jgi:hypothetical protein